MCGFYKESKIFEFSWSLIFTRKNAEDTESQNVEHLWSNCSLLVLRVKLSDL